MVCSTSNGFISTSLRHSMSGVHKMGEKVQESGEDDGMVSFSLRIPKALAKQIDDRRSVQKRSRNAEVTLLLERQIESEVEKDKVIIERMRDMNLTPQNNQS